MPTQIQKLVEAEAAAVVRAYEHFTLGVQGAWLIFSQNLGNENGSVAHMRLNAQLQSLAFSHASLLTTISESAVRAAHKQGVEDSALTPAIQSASAPQDFVDEIGDTIRSATKRDIRGISIMAYQAQIRFRSAAQTMTRDVARASALGELPGQSRDVFVQLDRHQRKRNSADFVTAALRMNMIAAYFQGFTESIVGRHDTFWAVHPEKSPEKLSLSSGWVQWAAENTHPNSRWSLQVEEPK